MKASSIRLVTTNPEVPGADQSGKTGLPAPEVSEKARNLLDAIMEDNVRLEKARNELSSVDGILAEKAEELVEAVRNVTNLLIEQRARNEVAAHTVIEMTRELERATARITELGETVDNLWKKATTDELTEVANRAHVQEAIHLEFERFSRYGYQASLIFVDLDHFKQINDAFWHESGDATLKHMGRLLKEITRTTDRVGRWGGEEFVILLPSTDLGNAAMIAEKIRTAIKVYEHPDFLLKSASFGVAQAMPGETVESWIKRADSAMYRAKNGGRDRVENDYGYDDGTIEGTWTNKGFVSLRWHPTYECGNHVLDSQHRGLFELANSILTAMMEGRAHSEVRELFGFIMNEIAVHFETEETILRESEYPHTDNHADIHRSLLEKAAGVLTRLDAGEDVLGEAFHLLAYEIVARHLLREDRRFFATLKPEEA